MQPLARGEKMKKNVLKNADIIRQGTLIIVLVLEMILFTALSDSFLTGSNLVNVLRQTSVTAISAVGMFMIILLGDIDLSVGSVYALIGVLCAYVFQGTESAVITVIAALALGTFIGFASGFVTAKGKIPAFVTTLSVMSICRGVAYILTDGTPIGIVNPKFTYLGAGYLFGRIPVPVVLMIVVFAIGFFLTGFTRFGRYIYASGGNEQASRWSGIKTDRIRIAVFTISGCFVGLSSLILAGRLGGGLPGTGNGSELDVITTVILGGTSLNGGKGKLWGVITGVFVIGVLTNGLTMMNLSTYWQQVVKGIIILIAVLFDMKAAKEE